MFFNNIKDFFSITIALLYQFVDVNPTLVGDINSLPSHFNEKNYWFSM
jgi:hypothetical protein